MSEVSCFSESVDPSPTESQSAKVFLEGIEELSGAGRAHVWRFVDMVVFYHIVGTLHIVVHVAAPRTPERLDSVHFIFLKFRLKSAPNIKKKVTKFLPVTYF